VTVHAASRDNVTGPVRVEFQGSDGLHIVGDRWDVSDRRGTVLLLHGGGQTRHSWARTGPRLAELGWAAVSVDTRGHGESGWPKGPEGYTLDCLVGDLKAMVSQLGESPIVVGASMGGMTALVAEGENPGLLRGLILVDVVPRLEFAGIAKISEFMRSGLSGFATLDEAADAVARYNPTRPRPADPSGLRKNLRLKADGRWYWHWDPQFIVGHAREPDRGIRLERSLAACRSVTVPTLLVRGRQSDVVGAEGTDEFLRLVPGSKFVEVGRAAHMVAGDDNDVFMSSVGDFLLTLG
jgi:pimeloyl-ACP methyl ester carboxylesterase